MTPRASRLELSGDRVRLREFGEAELRDRRYVSWLRDPDVVRTIGRVEYLMPIARSAIAAYARALMRSDSDAFFALYLAPDDRFIGTVRLGHIDWRSGVGDVGILIGDRTIWGQGIATEAIATVCRYAFEELGLRRLTGGTPATNLAMARCFRRLGFKREATLRKHLRVGPRNVDHLLFGIFAPEFRRAIRRAS